MDALDSACTIKDELKGVLHVGMPIAMLVDSMILFNVSIKTFRTLGKQPMNDLNGAKQVYEKEQIGYID